MGLELPITRLEGKWKVSQNRPAEDRAESSPVCARATIRCHAMAELVRERG